MIFFLTLTQIGRLSVSFVPLSVCFFNIIRSKIKTFVQLNVACVSKVSKGLTDQSNKLTRQLIVPLVVLLAL